MTDVKPFAFVLMPFEKSFSDIYKFGIKQTADENGVIAERVDEQHFSESILERVYRQIDNCDFVIAEMTGKNPNVFYEVGYAHAKGKLCALITQSASDIPFDLKHHPHVVYDGSIEDLKKQLGPKLVWLSQETRKNKAKSIVVSIRASEGFLKKNGYVSYGSFDLVIDLKNASSRCSPELEAIYLNTSPHWSLSLNGNECASNPDITGKLKRNLITPSLRRLAPGAFSQERVGFERELWSKFSGDEELDEYEVKGVLMVEVVTSEGTMQHEFPLEVEFNEFPF